MSTRNGSTELPNQSIPRRLLIVDDDVLVLERLGTELTAAGYEVKKAVDGEEALTLLTRQWIPVVITDWDMPVMDGLQFTQRLRALAVNSTYVIVLTATESSADYERGYCAGVDHYLSKKLPAPVLLGRVQLAFHGLLQRKLRRNRSHEIITVDLESGVDTPRHFVGRLNVEMRRAVRLQQRLAIVCMGIDPNGPPAAAQKGKTVSAEQMNAVFTAVRDAVRPETDWVVQLPGGQCAHRLAIILPEAGAAEAAAVEQRIRNAFVNSRSDIANAGAVKLSFGVAVLSGADDSSPTSSATALELLGLAERGRQGGSVAPTAALDTVQRSNDSDASIAAAANAAVAPKAAAEDVPVSAA